MNDGARQTLELDRLEAARAKLDQAQLALLTYHANRLREYDAYAPKHETAIAHIIATERPHQQRSEIESVVVKARDEARDREAREHLVAQERGLKEAEQKREHQAREAEKEQGKQSPEEKERHKRTLEAEREPVRGSVQRFDAKIADARAQRDIEKHEGAIARAAWAAKARPNYARYNELRSIGRGDGDDRGGR